MLYANKPDAYALTRAKNLGVSTQVLDRNDFYNSDKILMELLSLKVDLVVLAGFLWLMPANIIEGYHNRIVNIHPALLPKYGGKGMYGEHVHRAVVAAGEKESGITIHYVSAEYDSGGIIFQAACPVLPSDTAATLAERIHGLEHEHFPRVIEQVLGTI
jgi:phosphoribosylglycinamide formyltransferase-1